jgi:hypothetical protein
LKHCIVYNFSLVQELRTEVENLASRVLYMQEAKGDVRSDIAVMKRAAEKAHGEVTEAEQLKRKQVRRLHFSFPDAIACSRGGENKRVRKHSSQEMLNSCRKLV